jgi:predicted nucleic acid-binding protein
MPVRQQLRVYVDTSVFGGVFDEGFSEASEAVVECIRAGRYQLVTSDIVQDEVARGPERVAALFDDLLEAAEVVTPTEVSLTLRDAYVRAGIVTEKWAADALHVALATVARCTVIVSWNFRHLVHFQKVPLYGAVNQLNGYPPIAICSPPEVLQYDEETENP